MPELSKCCIFPHSWWFWSLWKMAYSKVSLNTMRFKTESFVPKCVITLRLLVQMNSSSIHWSTTLSHHMACSPQFVSAADATRDGGMLGFTSSFFLGHILVSQCATAPLSMDLSALRSMSPLSLPPHTHGTSQSGLNLYQPQFCFWQ